MGSSQFAVCNLIFFANCQPNKIDSLKNVLKAAREDTSSVLLQLRIANLFSWNAPDSMMEYAESAKVFRKK